MATKRQQIINQIGTQLLNKTIAGERVFSNPSTVSWSEDLPAINFFFRSEDIEVFAQSPKEFKRSVDLSVEVVAIGPEDPVKEGKAGVEDLLDLLTKEIECALIDGNDLQRLVSDVRITGIEFEYQGEGDRPIGSARMAFRFEYYEAIPADSSKQGGITDFDQANVFWKVGHDDSEPDDQIEAEDEIILDQ